jgi:hypothetical protein
MAATWSKTITWSLTEQSKWVRACTTAFWLTISISSRSPTPGMLESLLAETYPKARWLRARDA